MYSFVPVLSPFPPFSSREVRRFLGRFAVQAPFHSHLLVLLCSDPEGARQGLLHDWHESEDLTQEVFLSAFRGIWYIRSH